MKQGAVCHIFLRSLGVILAVLAVPGTLIWYDVMQSIKEVKRQQQSQQIVARLADLRLLLHRAESGQRSYLSSGNPVFLGQRNSALADLHVTLARLQYLTSGNTEQQQRIRELHHTINRQVEMFGQSTEMFEVRGWQAAQPLLKNGRKMRAAINKITYETRIAEQQSLHAHKLVTAAVNVNPPNMLWLVTSTIFLSRLLFSLRDKWRTVLLSQALQQMSRMWVAEKFLLLCGLANRALPRSAIKWITRFN